MTVRAYKLGALGQDSLSNVKSITAKASGAGTNYMTFESPVGTDYVVATGSSLYITKMDGHASTANISSYAIGYGDDGVANGASAPTNFKQMTGEYFTPSGYPTIEFDILVVIPTGKYPCLMSTNGNAANVTLYGIEV